MKIQPRLLRFAPDRLMLYSLYTFIYESIYFCNITTKSLCFYYADLICMTLWCTCKHHDYTMICHFQFIQKSRHSSWGCLHQWRVCHVSSSLKINTPPSCKICKLGLWLVAAEMAARDWLPVCSRRAGLQCNCTESLAGSHLRQSARAGSPGSTGRALVWNKRRQNNIGGADSLK